MSPARLSPPPTPTLPSFTRTDEHGGPRRLSLSGLSPSTPAAANGWSGNGAGTSSSASTTVRTLTPPPGSSARAVSASGTQNGSASASHSRTASLLGLTLKRARSASGGYAKNTHTPGSERGDDSDDETVYTADDRSDVSRSSIGLTDGEDDLYELDDAFAEDAEPLVSRRRRKKWDDEPGDRSLFELVAPLVLAHPLALFPVLSNVSTEFLPAGVALFVPLFCVIAVLSACAHIVIVYLAWYLKVRSFEDVFAACVGERFGRYGLGIGRTVVLIATMGITVGSMGSVFALLDPMVKKYLPAGWLESRITWTILSGLFLTPIVIPSRTLRTLRVAPQVIALLLPIVAFIVIGRTVEITKAAAESGHAVVSAAASASAAAAASAEATDMAKREITKRGLRGVVTGSAGSGLTTLVMFFSPHLLTLDVHASLERTHRQKFAIPCLAAGIFLILIALPAALVPYYLLPGGPSAFALLPADDGWVNTARVFMSIIVLGSITLWLLRGRDTILAALNVENAAERNKASRWVGVLMWFLIVGLACIGGWVADKIELLGVMATIAVGWLLPSVFFIITFHVRSPLAIIFPSHAPPPASADEESLLPRSRSSNGHIRTTSLTDPSADILLARKERQLQKRRLGRRLWQDLIVYVGILPIGCVSLAWTVVSFLGVW